MYYLPLNTSITTAPERTMRNGTIRPATTVTLTVARETDKAAQIALTSSRGEDFGDLIWLPKSQITVGAVAVVFHTHWVAEKMKSAFPYREDPFAHGCPSVGFRYPDAANMREVEAFAYRTLAETGAVTQEQIDAHFAPIAPVAAKPTTRKDIMARAWAIARAAAAQFGGTSREYYAESLRMAWAESR